MKFRLLSCWFCWFCQCTLGSERGKTSITHIPSRHAPLSYWHIKCGNRWTSHDTKVVALLLHPSYRAMRRFHLQHKAVYSPTDWPNWANPFCLLEVHLVPSLSSYWKSQLPQGRYGLDLCAEAFFILSRLFLFTMLWKLILDQQNAHSKWLFSWMFLKCFALEQTLHVSGHIAPLTLHSSNIENFLSKLSKTMVQETRNAFIEIILQRNSVTENRSDTKKELQPTGLKNNLGRGINPATVSLFISKTRDVTSGVSDPLKPVRPGLLFAGILFCSLLVSLKSRWKWSTVQAKQKILAKYPRLMLTVSGKDGEGLEKNRLNCLKNSCKKEEIEEGKTLHINFPPFSWPLKVKRIP